MEARELAVLGLQRALDQIRQGWRVRLAPDEETDAPTASRALERAFQELDAGEMERHRALDIALLAIGRFVGADFTQDEPGGWATLAAEALWVWESREGRTAGEVVAAFSDAIAQLSRG